MALASRTLSVAWLSSSKPLVKHHKGVRPYSGSKLQATNPKRRGGYAPRRYHRGGAWSLRSDAGKPMLGREGRRAEGASSAIFLIAFWRR